ncbi:MAG: hypothetical protein AAGF11_37680 [Myxococcota bacterium]
MAAYAFNGAVPVGVGSEDWPTSPPLEARRAMARRKAAMGSSA